MHWAFYILIFLISFKLLYLASIWVVGGMVKIGRFLGWQEFTVAFFVMAAAASLPNLFLGITSAMNNIPELSFGDVMGNNIVAITVAVAAAVFFAPQKEIAVESKTVKTTSLFTMVAAILPVILIADGVISRIDGILLLALFASYLNWLFLKGRRFSKIYNHTELSIHQHGGMKSFLRTATKVFLGIILTLIAAQIVASSSLLLSKKFGLPLMFIGILATGLGNALPEIYFAITSARMGKTSLILGNLMGAVIIPATLVLGVVALIQPIKSADILPVTISRVFLIAAALFFFLFVKTDKKITRRESMFLLLLYVLFVVAVLSGL